MECPLPEKELINLSAKLTQKIMTEYKIQSLDKLFHRSIGKHLKKKIYRTALEYKIQLFNQFPLEVMFL